MSAHHRIAIVLLAVLTALPVSGTICAMACSSEVGAVATHHESGEDMMACAQVASAVKHVLETSAHDCGPHESGAQPTPTTAATRADVAATAPPAVLTAFHTTPAISGDRSSIPIDTPPGTAPPIVTFVVLRV